MKRKTFVCIFAHPDDEAFGPGGTIAKLAKEYDVYVLCATKGQKGKNSSKESKNLGQIRSKELLASTRILGVKKVYFLGFQDGTLSNNLYHRLAEKIKEKLTELRPEKIMTFEPNGVSGHIDHITVSMVTHFVFYKLLFIKELWLHCGKKAVSDAMKNYFIYFPVGHTKNNVDKIINIEDVWDTKVAAMHQHASQMHDIERILRTQKDLPKEDYFLIIKK